MLVASSTHSCDAQTLKFFAVLLCEEKQIVPPCSKVDGICYSNARLLFIRDFAAFGCVHS